jgi:hypothetical protein
MEEQNRTAIWWAARESGEREAVGFNGEFF